MSRETGHALQWKACKKIVYAVFMQQSFLRDFSFRLKNTPAQIESFRSLYSDLTLHEFLNQRGRPSFPDPYKKKKIYIYIYIFFFLGTENILHLQLSRNIYIYIKNAK